MSVWAPKTYSELAVQDKLGIISQAFETSFYQFITETLACLE